MSDVFPTLWSPRSTILLRLSGGDEKSGVAGVVELDIAWQESSSCGHSYCGSASGHAKARDLLDYFGSLSSQTHLACGNIEQRSKFSRPTSILLLPTELSNPILI